MLRKSSAPITHLHLRVISPSAATGRLQAPGLDLACALGRTGISARKREGDGATPMARLRVLGGYYRPDRWPVRPRTAIALAPLRPDDGWCDAPASPAYNRPVRLPRSDSHETMWRGDGLYDVVLVLDWNIRPRRRDRGSAIFLHLRRPDGGATAGCVAIGRHGLDRFLARLSPGAEIVVAGLTPSRRREASAAPATPRPPRR